MRNYFDSDIKIASDTPSKDIRQRAPVPSLSEEIIKERASGHLKKARDFGMLMAKRMLRAQEKLAPASNDAQTELQYKVLFAFSVAAALETYCASTYVFRCALNAFYDTLKENHQDLYIDLDNTGAFSFYYLAFRKNGDIPENIGKTFAMLCGKDSDPELSKLGTSLYIRFMKYIKNEIESAKIGK